MLKSEPDEALVVEADVVTSLKWGAMNDLLVNEGFYWPSKVFPKLSLCNYLPAWL